MGAHLMVVHSKEEQVHCGREWGLRPAWCLPVFTNRSFADMGVSDVAEGFPSDSQEGCFSLSFLHLVPAAVELRTRRNHGNRNASPEVGGRVICFLFERPVHDSSPLMLPVVASA